MICCCVVLHSWLGFALLPSPGSLLVTCASLNKIPNTRNLRKEECICLWVQISFQNGCGRSMIAEAAQSTSAGACSHCYDKQEADSGTGSTPNQYNPRTFLSELHPLTMPYLLTFQQPAQKRPPRGSECASLSLLKQWFSTL